MILLFGRDAERQFAFARTIEFYQHDPLPGAEQQLFFVERKRERGADQGRQNMVRHVRRIMRMPIAQLRNHNFKCIQHVEVRAGIEITGCQGRGGVKNQQMTNA